MKKALITGISGQDGAYLSQILLDKGYQVVGISRDAARADFSRLGALRICKRVKLESADLTDHAEVLSLIERVMPDEIYHLSGQSSVSRSFREPAETIVSTTATTANLLDAIRLLNKDIRFFDPSSSEIFGDCDRPANENSPLNPYSPYGVARSVAHLQVRNYRESYGVFASSGILFNHESPFRQPHFVSKKIVSAACRIAAGSGESLRLGNLQVRRDWGWAPDYMDAAWRALQHTEPRDFVIATGVHHSLETFLDFIFGELNLDFRDHVVTDFTLFRPREIVLTVGDPSQANELLDWKATHTLPEITRLLVAAEMKQGKTISGRRGLHADSIAMGVSL